ncbi:MAG TPA: M23 family metallopeptidase [Spirochaetia bacterium]|nr:M23 family metallopeptidase [Spirochaetia bacterium]
MRLLRAAACLTAFFLGVILPSVALDWPVDKKIVIGTFGEEQGGRYFDGIDVGGGQQPVRAVLPGELVFRYDEGDDYSSLPRGLGSFVVLHHEGKIETVTGNLKKGSLGPLKTSYAAGDPVGTSGDTGFSDGIHLHFSLFDEEAASFVNPLSLLPPVADAQPPVIKQVFLSENDTLIPLANGVTVPSGQALVMAQAYDLRQDVRFQWPLGLYGAHVDLDGKEVSRLVFDSLQVVDGRAVLGGARLALAKVYAPDGMLVCGSVQLRPGSSHLIISVRDFAGNETTKEISFAIRE